VTRKNLQNVADKGEGDASAAVNKKATWSWGRKCLAPQKTWFPTTSRRRKPASPRGLRCFREVCKGTRPGRATLERCRGRQHRLHTAGASAGNRFGHGLALQLVCSIHRAETRPSAKPDSAVQASIAIFTQVGIGTVLAALRHKTQKRSDYADPLFFPVVRSAIISSKSR